MHSRLVEQGGRGVSVRRLGTNRSGEIRLSRFLRNDAVTVPEMISVAAGRVSARCAGRDVIVIQDTTVVRSSGGGGDYLHAVVAVDASDGAMLGVVHGEFLSRSVGRRETRRSRPIEEKESYRWLEGAERAAAVCGAAARVTVVADRESDIFEAFARRPASVELLVRAAHDRSLEDNGQLFAYADALPVAAWGRLDLPAKPGRKARTARMAVRFAAVRLARPANGVRTGLPESVAMTLVDIREAEAPGGEAPVHWRLLTSQAVADPVQAMAVADLYRRRWTIEQVFRTMKTQGFDIERLRIGDTGPLFKLVAATFIAAVTIQQLVHAREGDAAHGPLRPVTDAFEPEDMPLLEAFCAKLEGKTQKQKNPHPKTSLAYAAWVCARLGGWTGYYGKPGPIVMLNGWLDFQAAKRGVTALASYSNV